MRPEGTLMKPETEATAMRLATEGTPAPRQRTYARPLLEVLGDLRTLTLGGTPGGGDSGNPLEEDIPQP
jgi:hypothetical protein